MSKQKAGGGKYPEPTVGAIIANSKREIFLVKSHKWHNKYVMPGGHIELGEKMADALKREIKEETGMRISNIRFLSLHEFVFQKTYWKKKHLLFVNFYCTARHTSGVTLNDEAEEYVWVGIAKALKLDLEPSTRKAIIEYKSRLQNPAVSAIY